jgi:hypothetical protein
MSSIFGNAGSSSASGELGHGLACWAQLTCSRCGSTDGSDETANTTRGVLSFSSFPFKYRSVRFRRRRQRKEWTADTGCQCVCTELISLVGHRECSTAHQQNQRERELDGCKPEVGHIDDYTSALPNASRDHLHHCRRQTRCVARLQPYLTIAMPANPISNV